MTNLQQQHEGEQLKGELRATRARLKSILDDSADGILVLDRENRILHWNKGAERIFGSTADDVVDTSFDTFVPDDLKQKGELAEIAERVERDGFLADYETRRVAKDGRVLIVNITSTLLRDGSGQAVGRSSIVRDVTESKKIHEELLRTRHLASIGEMAATVAHEIRNPLAGISGAIQVIRDGLDDEDPRRNVVREMLEHVSRLDDTVRDMLLLSKPWQPVRQACVLGDVVEKILADMRAHPEFDNVRFSCEGDGGHDARIDPLLLEQVMMNLFQNAADAMGWRGEITCRLDGDDRKVSIEVLDHGSGCSDEVRGKLFDPFFTTKVHGTGLGLAVCKSIMDSHRGEIEIEAEAGRGTTVKLSFPKGE
ncbi:MAG: PAS domain S-box protein [Verrucomicrobia bacterium]|nr:PAS domain S-box protein [Verrucomicrobiota bacterium]MDA1087094.1 PAS domain S-box protein [Verrucomicrobiota bacterium]